MIIFIVHCFIVSLCYQQNSVRASSVSQDGSHIDNGMLGSYGQNERSEVEIPEYY